MNGRSGIPGMRLSTSRMMPPRRIGPTEESNCAPNSWPRLLPDVALVTNMPDAVAVMRAGICVTSPSPTVRIEYFFTAAASGIPAIRPSTKPPTRLIAVMMIAAMASPRTNRLAPSIVP